MGKHAQGTQRGHRLDGGRVAGQRGLAHGAQSTGLGKEAARTWRESKGKGDNPQPSAKAWATMCFS